MKQSLLRALPAACWTAALLCCGWMVFARAADSPSSGDSGFEEKIVPIHRTDAQWKQRLSVRQFEVTRRKATEPAFSGKLLHNKKQGVYRCVCCNLELFSSETKFDSGTGWPSFWQPITERRVTLAEDRSELPARTEVMCARCEAHLGHVFDDGPKPTGLRYCMNSIALDFVEKKPKPITTSRATEK